MKRISKVITASALCALMLIGCSSDNEDLQEGVFDSFTSAYNSIFKNSNYDECFAIDPTPLPLCEDVVDLRYAEELESYAYEAGVADKYLYLAFARGSLYINKDHPIIDEPCAVDEEVARDRNISMCSQEVRTARAMTPPPRIPPEDREYKDFSEFGISEVINCIEKPSDGGTVTINEDRFKCFIERYADGKKD